MPRRFARRAAMTGAWRPSSAAYLLRDALRRDEPPRADEDHLRAAAGWLARAQDATTDGGVSGRYFLASGWSPSYPETTGYLVPTFTALAEELKDPTWHERAARAIEFLLRLQRPDGSFPGGEIGPTAGEPSVFNTGQILHGMLSWTKDGNPDALDAARRAGRWLCEMQEADGSFRAGTYLNVAATYHAHAVCWLADAAIVLDDTSMLDATRRYIQWTVSHYDPGARWLDLAGFTAEDHQRRRAVTHTFAYALFGTLHAAQQAGMPEAVDMVRDVAARAADLTIEARRLPGVLDAAWESREKYVCLTGSAQMALLWSRLDEVTPDPRWPVASGIVIDDLKRAHPMRSRDPGILGGIAGSRPAWADYIPFALPNWAAKFFVDAMLVRAGRTQPGRIGGRI